MHNYKYMHFITRIDFAISLSLVDDTTSNRPPASLKARPILSSRMIDTTDRFFFFPPPAPIYGDLSRQRYRCNNLFTLR